MNALRILLLPLSVSYAVVVIVRNRLFDIGLLSTTRVSVPVISVGNISAGGVGKTPLVELIARHLRGRGKKVAVISRGYKRNTRGYVVVSNGVQRCADAAQSGDEPSQLADKLDGVVIAVDEQRVRAARHVIADFGVQVILLDDGFQHRWLHRDLNICIVAYEELSSKPWLLPAGNRREPFSSLDRSDLIIVSRCQDGQSFAVARALVAQWTDKPVAGMKTYSAKLKNAGNGNTIELIDAVGRKMIAFSGIGHPESFEQTLQSLSIGVSAHHIFPDHHRFSSADIGKILGSFKNSNAELMVTTEKDVARLRGQQSLAFDFFTNHPVYYLEIEPAIVWEKEMLYTSIEMAAKLS